MADIATLGLAIDSRQAVAAKQALDGFKGSAQGAAAAAAQVEKASGSAAKGQAALAQQAQASGKQIGLTRHELVNFSRQMQDVGVSLASGQSPFTVLVQQGTQVADIFANSRGTLRGFGSQIASIITPTRALGLGIGLVGAAVYAGYSYWKNYALALDDTARASGAALREISQLQGAAAIKGIGREDFSEGMAKFGQEVYLAKNNMGQLGAFLRANGGYAKDFGTAFDRVADLIKNAENDVQRIALLQQMGLPSSMQWVRFWSQGADGIRRAKSEMAGLADENAKLIQKQRELDEAWNSFWTKAGEKARNAFVSAVSGIQGFLADMAGGFSSLAGQRPPTQLRMTMPMTGGTGSNKPTVDPAVLQVQISREQQRLALLGSTTTALEAQRQVELQVQAARLNGVSIDQKRVETLKRLAAENNLGITALRSSADAYRIEADTVGMATGEATAYGAAQNIINQARRDGKELTAANVEAIKREASALGEAAQTAENMRFAYEGLVRGPMQTFRQELQNGATFFDALKRSGLSALDALSSRLMDMASQGLFRSIFGGMGGGLFGGGNPTSTFGINPIEGAFRFGGASANGNVFSGGNVIPFARGGVVSRPTMFPMAGGAQGLMGEAGPEAIIPLRRGADGKLGVSAGGSGGNTHVSVGGMTITIQGNADSDAIKELRRLQGEFDSRVESAVRKARQGRRL